MKQRSRPKDFLVKISKGKHFTWLCVILSVLIPIVVPLILWHVRFINTYITQKLGLELWHFIAIMTGGVSLFWTHARYKQSQAQIKTSQEQLKTSRDQFLLNSLNTRMFEAIKTLSDETTRKQQTARNIINTITASIEGNYTDTDKQKELFQKLFLFDGMNLHVANLNGVRMPHAQLQNTNLQWAQLQNANLQGANLQRAQLQNTNLQWAQLQDANLQGANLQNANLQGANLQGAQLQEANLEEANLEGAHVSRSARWLGADKDGVVKNYDKIIWEDDNE